MIGGWEQVVRNTTRTWNTLAARLVDLRLHALTPPPVKRTPYWIAIEDMPAGLQVDITAFLQHLEEPALFAHEARQVLKPATVAQYRSNIIMLISALVAAGTPIDSLASLGCAVAPANVEKALIFLHDRFNKRVTSGMFTMAVRARIVAHWCNLPAPAMKGLDNLIERLKAWQPGKRGMTEKNRALLDRLDDQRFRDLIYLLTRRLMERAGKANHPRSAVSLARTAVAIEILLTCSIRRENLVDLELGRNIRKLGQGSNARWIIEFEGEDVKNNEPLRFVLPRESADLLGCSDDLTAWDSQGGANQIQR
ncbi:MAG: hypothetical protein WBA88_26160 [Pseudaminobacter sp.]